ncbi:MAG: (deoxy)nucleoside triphosphate pyrophosphohydrolase [Spirochaetales bacterium]|nr:(deoxy)nucleoside triphosphate pyrophosphohydrolase [Spirochaetales bacterium]
MKNIEVVAAVLIQDGKVFAAQRNAKGEVGLKWEFPGGKTEAGESHHEALARELHEELGIQVQVGDFLMTINHQYQAFALTMHCYFTTVLSGTLTLHEHIASRWLGRDDLETVDWAPADVPVLERIRDLLK